MSDEDKRVSLHVGIGHVESQARELYDERRRHFCNDCQHEPDGQDPFPERCFDCSRYYSDLWEGYYLKHAKESRAAPLSHVSALEGEIARLRELVETVSDTWRAHRNGTTYKACPWCHMETTQGHADDCPAFGKDVR